MGEGGFLDGDEYADGYGFHGYQGGGGGFGAHHDGGMYNDVAYDPEFDREASDDEGGGAGRAYY